MPSRSDSHSQQSAELMAVIDFDGRLIDLSPAWEQILGYGRDEIIGRLYRDFLPAGEEGDVFSSRPAKGTWQFQNRWVAKDGRVLNFTWTAMVDPDRQVMFATARDINMRQSLKDDLRKALQRSQSYQFALDQAALVAITDTQGHITYANDKFCEVSGYGRDELLGENHRILNSGVQDRAFFSQMWKTITQGRVWKGEICNRAKDGTLYWVDTVIVPFVDGETGRPYQYVAIRNEITERKTNEAKLLQSSKMSSLGEMAGGVAHEINNPLAIISARVGQLRTLADHDRLDKDRVLVTVGKIEATVARIARIVKGLRSFSRDGSDDPFDEVPVQMIVDDTLEFCRARFAHHDIELRLPSPLDPQLAVECRLTQLSQVLLNLLTNAFDAVLALPEKWVEISVRDLGDWIELRVTDSGSGVPAELRDLVMQPFFTTKCVGQGTGLGLSISKGIIESHKGRLAIDPDSSHTSFTVTLPKCQARSESGFQVA